MRSFIPFVLVSMLVTASCVRRPPVIQYGPEGPLQRAEEVLERVDAQEEKVTSLQGEARLSVDSPQARGSVSMLVAVAPGGRLHLETLDFFGKPQAVLVSDGQRFGLFQGQEGRYYQGPASAENLSRFLPVVLPPEELGALLLGRVPRVPSAEVGALTVDREVGAYRFVLTRDVATQELWVDPLHLRVQESRVRGVPGYDLRLEDFFTSEGTAFPRQVTLRADAAKTTMTLRYGDVTLNAQPPDTLFQPRPPAGVPVVEVDSRGAPLSSPRGAE